MTIMTRSAAEFWWKEKLPRDVKYLYRDYSHQEWIPVTWTEIFAERKSKQQDNIERKCSSKETKPCILWVFHNNTVFFGGWYIYVLTLKHEFSINFRQYDNPDMVLKAMKLFPCGIIPMIDNFDIWCLEFSKRYSHIGFNRTKNQGIRYAYCTINGGRISDLFLKPT